MTNAGIVQGTDLWRSSLDRTADLAALAPVALGVLGIGLALWLVGDRLFRPTASLVGAALGALLGLLVAETIKTETLGSIPAPYAAIGIGSLLGLGIGALMYRLAVSATAAVTLGSLAAVLAATLSLHEPGTGWFERGGSVVPERPETIAETASAHTARVTIEQVSFGELWTHDPSVDKTATVEQIKAAAESVGSLAKGTWTALPGQTRTPVSAAAILGGVVGLALGLLRPRATGPAIAALAGSALWLGATTVLLSRAGQSLPSMPTEQPGAWLAAWVLVALVGFAVQRRAVRPAALVTRDK